MKEFYKNNRIAVNKLIASVFFLVAVYVFFNYIIGYVAPFLLAYILSLVLNPLADFIQKKVGTPRWFASLLCILLLIFILVFLGTNLFTKILEQAQGFSNNFPQIADQTTKLFDDLSKRFSNIINLISEDLKIALNDLFSSMLSSITSSLGTFFKDFSLAIVSKVPSMFMILLLSLISCYFFIKDKDLIYGYLKTKSPYAVRKNVNVVKKGVIDAVLGYIKAQSIIMSIIGIIVILSLTLLGYPYALFIGLLIALVDALPIFGSGFILWPWILISFIASDYKSAIWLLATYGIVFLTRQALEPKILGKEIGVHPILTLMSIYIGLKVFGGFGFILGPFTLILMKSLLASESEQ